MPCGEQKDIDCAFKVVAHLGIQSCEINVSDAVDSIKKQVSETFDLSRQTEINLPEELIDKVPSDGLCGKTDEDNLGFSYQMLDRYIRTGQIEDKKIQKKIDDMHERNLFKLQLTPAYDPGDF